MFCASAVGWFRLCLPGDTKRQLELLIACQWMLVSERFEEGQTVGALLEQVRVMVDRTASLGSPIAARQTWTLPCPADAREQV
jgi:hypothetical protein